MEEADVRTRLNSDGGGGGDDWADLDVDTETLEELARTSGTLVESLDRALGAVRGEEAGPVAIIAPLRSFRELERVAASWESRLTGMRQECVTMTEALGAAAGLFVAIDADIRADLSTVAQPLTEETGR
ncbi:hypothetical protein [Streptomyces sp. URMC 129]|uniref:hypothetical protein n=1 Tax=Streptomyces sp. URMC 129 TaxID=3423407 RepID=UPI003F1B5CB1